MNAFSLAAGTLALTLATPLALGGNLILDPSFEEPKITGTVDAKKGGTPVKEDFQTTWAHFMSMDKSGKVSVGLTDTIARTGKQSVYVQFDQVEGGRGAFLMSDLIPVKGLQKYRVSIWGRVDKKRPLTLDQGRPYQVLEVEFYPADQASRIGEMEARTQMIPGMVDRLLFISSKWTEYYAEFISPEGAEFMKVTFKWETPKREGPADGIIYFDDAAVDGVAGTLVPSFDPPEPVEAPAPAPDAAGAKQAPAGEVPKTPSAPAPGTGK